MSWKSKGDGVSIATAELAAERGELAVIHAQPTHVLRKAQARQRHAGHGDAAERIGQVLTERDAYRGGTR